MVAPWAGEGQRENRKQQGFNPLTSYFECFCFVFFSKMIELKHVGARSELDLESQLYRKRRWTWRNLSSGGCCVSRCEIRFQYVYFFTNIGTTSISGILDIYFQASGSVFRAPWPAPVEELTAELSGSSKYRSQGGFPFVHFIFRDINEIKMSRLYS